jgi:hypothetical protein
MSKNLALFLFAFFTFSTVCAQNLKTKQFICIWEAIRTEKEPNYTPYSVPNGEQVPGLVTVNDGMVTYGKNKFQRSNIPDQKRPNGTNLVHYTNGEDMIVMGYQPNNSVVISIVMNSGVHLAGKCVKA